MLLAKVEGRRCELRRVSSFQASSFHLEVLAAIPLHVLGHSLSKVSLVVHACTCSDAVT